MYEVRMLDNKIEIVKEPMLKSFIKANKKSI